MDFDVALFIHRYLLPHLAYIINKIIQTYT